MKARLLKRTFSLFLIFFPLWIAAQTDTTLVGRNARIEGYNGGVFTGKILQADARELRILTADRGEIVIPKFEVKEIRILDVSDGVEPQSYQLNLAYSTRYFLTTNGFPIAKGDSYIQWNLFGPDFQFGVLKKLGVGLMTSWIGSPMIFSAKYSVALKEKVNLAFGTLLGTGSYIAPDYGLAVPFAALTLGTRGTNINLSGGYGVVFVDGDLEARTLISVGGAMGSDQKVSFVFDSFLFLPGRWEEYTYQVYVDGKYLDVKGSRRDPAFGVIVPGIRFNFDDYKSFQFGFGAIYREREFLQIPFPFMQWHRRI